MLETSIGYGLCQLNIVSLGSFSNEFFDNCDWLCVIFATGMLLFDWDRSVAYEESRSCIFVETHASRRILVYRCYMTSNLGQRVILLGPLVV
jgi:hypothetical protein